MSKSPFEIRLELLQLANGILNDANWAERNRVENDWNTQRELAMKAYDAGADIDCPPAPIVPVVQEDEIIRLARKLNEFISHG
jgi:hypothetical protein